jgi:hypothetical protein
MRYPNKQTNTSAVQIIDKSKDKIIVDEMSVEEMTVGKMLCRQIKVS